MLSYEEVVLIKRSYPTMHCNDVDFYKQYETLYDQRPNNIYELGVGSGEWIMCMDECLPYDPWWIGVENFASAYTEVDYYGELPKTPEELVSQISLSKFIHYYTPWEPILGDNINPDVCRIDMSIRTQEQYDIITDRCKILFIDDVFKPDYAFRLEFALNSKMEILWKGEKEVCLSSGIHP